VYQRLCLPPSWKPKKQKRSIDVVTHDTDHRMQSKHATRDRHLQNLRAILQKNVPFDGRII